MSSKITILLPECGNLLWSLRGQLWEWGTIRVKEGYVKNLSDKIWISLSFTPDSELKWTFIHLKNKESMISFESSKIDIMGAIILFLLQCSSIEWISLPQITFLCRCLHGTGTGKTSDKRGMVRTVPRGRSKWETESESLRGSNHLVEITSRKMNPHLKKGYDWWPNRDPNPKSSVYLNGLRYKKKVRHPVLTVTVR